MNRRRRGVEGGGWGGEGETRNVYDILGGRPGVEGWSEG